MREDEERSCGVVRVGHVEWVRYVLQTYFYIFLIDVFYILILICNNKDSLGPGIYQSIYCIYELVYLILGTRYQARYQVLYRAWFLLGIPKSKISLQPNVS